MSEIEKMYENANVEKYWNSTPYGGIEEYYPPFTAEKQLKIVKMILLSTWWINLKRLQFSQDYENGLAELVNSLWQDLSPEEKQQVKEILE